MIGLHMTTVDAVRRLALSLPRSYEALVRDRVKFRVGRIVYLSFSRDETLMGFAFPKEERAALVASACSGSPGGPAAPSSSPSSSRTAPATPAAGSSTSSASPTTPTPIDHVVFIVKENRAFDHYFGTYPGADGATTGKTHDGRTVPLKPAPDIEPIDLPHSFTQGLVMIDGGKMDGLDLEESNLAGYDQHSRADIPNYFK